MTTNETTTSHPVLSRIRGWSRISRIAMSMVVTTVIVALIWIVFTLIFGLDAGSSAVVRFVLIFGGGLAVYLYGWWALVGFDDGPNHQWQPTQHSMWYLMAGLLALVLDIALIAIGLATSNII